ncbi:MAG: hypothetical protein GY811_00110 [Myxococcales bacterium]|nr:hypothetical protein [Myxococcales bacterium]
MTYCSTACANDASAAIVVAPVETPKEPAREAAERVEAGRGLEAEAAAPAEKTAKDALEPAAPARSEAPGSASLESQGISASIRKRVLLASGAIMAGGIAIAVVHSLSSSPSSNERAGHAEAGIAIPNAQFNPKLAPTKVALPEPRAEEPPTAAELRALSITELERQLEEGSPRFKRLAGMALAREKHVGALAILGELLKSETSDLSRIDIAYGMALAGDASGRDYLVGELDSRRRDVRMDASRRLVQLGDDSGRKALHQMLGVRTHRLGAASVLAILGDEKGIDILRQTYEKASSSDENRMRAAVGLGLAGDDSARALLLEILSEGKYVVDAAGALATLGDKAAVPALKRQLMLTAMRVGAAESLHSMKIEVDIADLASALVKSNTEGRIAAAEAILVLGQ